MEITPEFAKRAQKEAEWAYDKAIEKFYYSMLEIVFLRIKSHLSQQGLTKVVQLDKKRANNENLGVEFSKKTWEALAEAWIGAEGLAMTKISNLYGLDISDLDMSKISKLKENSSTTKCNPSS